MPSAKSGKSGNAASPLAPNKPIDADQAKPGSMVSSEDQEEEKPFKPAEQTNEEGEEESKVWIEIELVDEDDNPVPGEKYKCTMPDGTVDTGTLDNKGFKRIEGMDPGTCKITFPNLDKEAWEKA